ALRGCLHLLRCLTRAGRLTRVGAALTTGALLTLLCRLLAGLASAGFGARLRVAASTLLLTGLLLRSRLSRLRLLLPALSLHAGSTLLRRTRTLPSHCRLLRTLGLLPGCLLLRALVLLCGCLLQRLLLLPPRLLSLL